jgi:hypothetical protein
LAKVASSDLAGPQPGFRRQQHDHCVAKGVPGCGGEGEQVIDSVSGKNFCLLAGHPNNQIDLK